MNYSVNRQLALSSLKSNTRAIKFDGKDKASYSPWKVAIELETEGLFLSDAEWLEILQLRTAGIALELVKEGRKLALINPSKAVQFIWDKFNKRYGKKCQLATDVLKRLQSFPTVSMKHRENLYRFSDLCDEALILSTTEEGKSLIALDCEDMQKTVVSRLDEKLRMKWGEKSAKIERHSPSGTVLFQDFCQWLDEIASQRAV